MHWYCDPCGDVYIRLVTEDDDEASLAATSVTGVLDREEDEADAEADVYGLWTNSGDEFGCPV